MTDQIGFGPIYENLTRLTCWTCGTIDPITFRIVSTYNKSHGTIDLIILWIRSHNIMDYISYTNKGETFRARIWDKNCSPYRAADLYLPCPIQRYIEKQFGFFIRNQIWDTSTNSCLSAEDSLVLQQKTCMKKTWKLEI